MATFRRPRYCLHWEETECLSYYEMQSLHELFEVVGSQLTETDVEVLSFLLDETYPGRHPLDPAGWTAEVSGDPATESAERMNSPSPRLLEAWRRLQPSNEPCPEAVAVAARHRPKSGVSLLLELERRGYVSEGNLEPLLQLLRVLTRHDLLPFVSRKKRRTVSPERPCAHLSEVEGSQVSGVEKTDTHQQTEQPQGHTEQPWRAGIDQSRPVTMPTGCKRGRGRRRTRAVKETSEPLCEPPAPNKLTCDIRLRVRAEYSEHDSALRGGVSSDKQQRLERQFELFSRASLLLRARDLGSIVCDIKFSEVANLDAFWADYLSGALLEALKGVFITDSLKQAAGQEGVRLLVSVDQDDYEEGRKLLLSNHTHYSTCRNSTDRS